LLVSNQVFLALLLLASILTRQPALILGVVVLQQCAGSALVPTMQALIPHVVAGDQRAAVLARNALAVGASVVIGPPIGAALLALTSPAFTVLLDAASFVVALTLLATLPMEGTDDSLSADADLPSGAWKRVCGDRVLLNICTGMVGCYATVTALQAGLVFVAVERFGSANGVGLLYSAVGVGAVAGGLVARRSPRLVSRVGACMGAEMAAAIALTQTNSLALTVLFLAVVAAAGSLVQVGGGMAVMHRVEERSLAAVNGVVFAFGYAGMGMGALIALVGSHLIWEVPVLILASATVVTLSVFRLSERHERSPHASTTRNAALLANRGA
jgi:MFS family permease